MTDLLFVSMILGNATLVVIGYCVKWKRAPWYDPSL